MTAFNSKTGGFHLTTVGRVQTPTLAMVVEREEKIRKFKPHRLLGAGGQLRLQGRRICRALVRRGLPEARRECSADEHATAFRLWDKARAEAIRAKCEGKPGMVTEEESKPSTQLSPLLFDLTSLQREANGRFGFSARTTLQLAQALYEKHKVLTYPRTDARALPEDYVGHRQARAFSLACPTPTRPLPTRSSSSGWVKPNKRIFNNAKISDHFAIIPTGTAAQEPVGVPKPRSTTWSPSAFLAVFYPAAEYQHHHPHHPRRGRGLQDRGQGAGQSGLAGGVWQGSRRDEKDEDEGGSAATGRGRSRARRSAPRTSSSSRCSHQAAGALQRSHAAVGHGRRRQDGRRRGAARRDGRRGLGTPATRAQIIENLISEQYIHRDGKELIPTAKAFSLITLLKGLGIHRADLARADRRLGIQAGADGAGRSSAAPSS
jgi:DNA topoisomerase-3